MLFRSIRATNNLNDRTQQKLNVIATRKLPIRESGGTWSDPVSTRSIIWAFVDIFRASYGGRILDDGYFDWEALEELDAIYASRGEYFDWTFRDPITVWEAAKVVARAGRAVPLLSGSLITMKRDAPSEIPVTMFTPENIIAGSFQWNIRLWEPYDYDSLLVEYTEVETGYQPEQVPCTLPGGTTDSPKNIRIPGVQDRNHAYREGMFILATELYLRENISFETGLEGFLPSFGDLVAISHDVPRWGQSGYIVSVEEVSDGYLLLLSETPTWEESGEHQIILRGKDGGLIGPYTAYETSDPKVIQINTATEIDFLLTGTTEPMLYLFGPVSQITTYGKVVSIEPQGGETVKVTLVNDDQRIYSYDELEAPPLGTPAYPPEVPDLPTISSLRLSQVEGDLMIISASWSAALGAQSYIVQISADDGTTWQEKGTTTKTSMQIQAIPGTIYVRVAGQNNGQGPWIQGSITLGLVNGLAIDPTWDDLEWGARWWEKTGISDWQVSVYDASTSPPTLARTEILDKVSRSYLYTYAKALVDDNLVRVMMIEVDARILNEETGLPQATGYPRSLEVTNSLPTAPIHVDGMVIGETSDGDLSIRFTWTNPAEYDLHRIWIWVSESPFFSPEDTGALVYEHTATTPGWAGLPEEAVVSYRPSSMGVLYWWIGVMDVWGDEAEIDDSTPGNVASGVPIELPWILTTGSWDDIGRWDDDETWRDS